MERKEHEIGDLTCPSCHKGADIASSLECRDNPPTPGDVIICFYCQVPNLFTEGKVLRSIDEEDRAEGTDLHRAWPRIMELAGAVASFRAQNGGASA